MKYLDLNIFTKIELISQIDDLNDKNKRLQFEVEYMRGRANAEKALSRANDNKALIRETEEADYFDKKSDKGKQKALFPREVLSAIFENKSVYAKLLNEQNDSVSNIIKHVEEVLQFGSKKYAPSSWKTVPDAEDRYWDAYERHLSFDSTAIDTESNLLHSTHRDCNLVFLLWFEINTERLRYKKDLARNEKKKKLKAEGIWKLI